MAAGTGVFMAVDAISNLSSYKLVLRDGKVCGAILIGHAELADPVTRAVEANMDVIPVLAPLERGDWSVLSTA